MCARVLAHRRPSAHAGLEGTSVYIILLRVVTHRGCVMHIVLESAGINLLRCVLAALRMRVDDVPLLVSSVA